MILNEIEHVLKSRLCRAACCWLCQVTHCCAHWVLWAVEDPGRDVQETNISVWWERRDCNLDLRKDSWSQTPQQDFSTQCPLCSILSFKLTSLFSTFCWECPYQHQLDFHLVKSSGKFLALIGSSLDKVDHFLLIKIPTSGTPNCCSFLPSLMVSPNVGVPQGSLPGSLSTVALGNLI